MKLIRTALILLALALLSGCSRVTLGYNHGDWLLRYWINGYTSFNAQQEYLIRQEAADYMRWHRQNALPEYIAFLQHVNTLISRDGAPTAADVMHSRAEIGRLYKLTMTPFIRPAAHVLSSLDSRQIEKLRSTLDEKNRADREETFSGNAREDLVRRAKRYLRFTENLVGSLSDKQKQTIEEMSWRIPFTTPAYFDHRETQQAGLIALLDNHAGEDKISAHFRQWLNTPETPVSPQQQQIAAAYDSAMNEMIVRIFDLLTTEQKDHLRKRITGYIEDFQKLHAVTEVDEAAPARD